MQTPGMEIKNNPEINYEHAKIILTEYGYMLKDLNSSNGTYLRIKNSIVLENNTILKWGKVDSKSKRSLSRDLLQKQENNSYCSDRW